jgi:hypothetical protein
MVRSINIGKTDQLVWDMIKDVLQQIRDRSPVSCDHASPEHHHLDDGDGLLTDGITWMSPEQIDLLSDEEKKVVVSKMITRITAHFDRASNKHRIDVTFSETVACLLAADGVYQRTTGDDSETGRCQTGTIRGNEGNGDEESVGKKSGGSMMTSAADHAYSLTVE